MIIIQRAAPGIEPGTSRTRSENHATKPNSHAFGGQRSTLRGQQAVCKSPHGCRRPGRLECSKHAQANASERDPCMQQQQWRLSLLLLLAVGCSMKARRRRNRTPACLHAPWVEATSEHQPDSPPLPNQSMFVHRSHLALSYFLHQKLLDRNSYLNAAPEAIETTDGAIESIATIGIRYGIADGENICCWQKIYFGSNK